ncbi:MAG: META domain-containing protein, partial [Phenylobacterium sp.]
MSIHRFAATALLALCLSACAATRPDAPPALSGDWRVEDLDGRGVPDRVPFAVGFADGRVSASAGCNRLSGAFEQSGDRLRIGPLASTRMACSPALEEQERRLAASLG